MKFKLLFCIVLSGLYCNVAAKHSHCSHCDQKITTSAAHHTHANAGHQTQNSSSHSDTEVAKMAISTLTSMATNILSIGTDPHNPQNIGANVIGILSSFVNLIVYALKNPQFAELMEDELFQQELRLHLMKNLALEQPESVDAMIEA